MSNQPVKKFRIGYLTVNIWENEGQGDRTWYSVDIQRTFKDGDDLRNTSALNHADLLPAAHLLTKANAWIMDQ